MRDGKRIVRDGYDRVAQAYLQTRRADGPDVALLSDLLARLPHDARVLDAGCGAGEPVTRLLSQSAAVVGVDISVVQLRLAHESLPGVPLVQADLTALTFAAASFDAICSYYAIIHVPREEHFALLRDFGRMLKPGGHALLCMGRGDTAGEVEPDWFGAPMYWSHFDSSTNIALMAECGFDVLWARAVADGLEANAAHLFILGRKKEG